MDGPEGVRLDQCMGASERGNLWRATRQRPGDRIVRIIEPRFCDRRFRQALTSLRERQHPRMLPITREGWAGAHFYIEYGADSPWEILDAHLQRLHWRPRVEVLDQICDIVPQWSNSPVHPLGLNGCNILMMNNAGRWFPWLLPCPSLKYTSPCDFFGCDPAVLSAVAPEVVRGVDLDERAQDIYALGALALHALGCTECQVPSSDEDRVELQACGALLTCDLQASAIEPFLHGLEAVQQLVQVSRHYTQIVPDARPRELRELRSTCRAALAASEPVALARQIAGSRSSREALKILHWGFESFGESLAGRLLAADLCDKLEELGAALEHLDHAVLLAPGDAELRWRRCTLRWLHYCSLPPLTPGEPDAEGDLLLSDLTLFQEASDGIPAEKNAPHLRAAWIHRRRGDLVSAARELFAAAELEPADMEALWLYGECLKGLGEMDGVAQVVQEARRRVGRMTINEMMPKTEADRWCEKFDRLLQS